LRLQAVSAPFSKCCFCADCPDVIFMLIILN
jgi:hypothetical protein